MTNRFSFRLVASLLALAGIGGMIMKAGLGAGNAGHAAESSSAAGFDHSMQALQSVLPAGEADAMARLTASSRHGEWVTVQSGKNPATGLNDSTRAWVVYPERSDKAPVVIVIHEIYGLTPWIRSVADQLAADGFIAVAPDFLTMKNVPGDLVNGPERGAATAAIRSVTNEEVNRQIDAVAKYAMALPAATQKYGVVGYCWGGGASFMHAIHSPTLGAAVVYYGTSPAATALATIKAPVLGLYGGSDARVNASVPAADSAMKALNKSFAAHTFEGAGHGFLRQQTTAPNMEATRKAWPLTIQFFKTHLEAR
jgi:carboxymethylenebutenolidase